MGGAVVVMAMTLVLALAMLRAAAVAALVVGQGRRCQRQTRQDRQANH
jgi:hypothetical protein